MNPSQVGEWWLHGMEITCQWVIPARTLTLVEPGPTHNSERNSRQRVSESECQGPLMLRDIGAPHPSLETFVLDPYIHCERAQLCG